MPVLELNASPTSVIRDMPLRLVIKHALVSQIISYSSDIVDQSTQFILQFSKNVLNCAKHSLFFLRWRLETNAADEVLLVFSAAWY